MRNWFVTAKWLRGHSDQVIEITTASFFGTDPLEPGVRLLAEMPGVYRIARIEGGRFGRQGNDLRRQVRALLAVTECALRTEPLGNGGWQPQSWRALEGVEVYDPRAKR